ncbi:DDE-type integrase/transposase/recombinase [Lactobacillus helveticus]|uniref:DDE-type integrase/transposase/recombinase n=1 Tax=Lactobacillus helveticus TaxID=1587 RepID=UPI0030D5B480
MKSQFIIKLFKAYLCTIFDLYDRYPVGYAISKHNDTALVQSAYEQAIKAYPNAHPLFHSDRGFQFTRAPFQNQLKKQGMIQSMSRVGCAVLTMVQWKAGKVSTRKCGLFFILK